MKNCRCIANGGCDDICDGRWLQLKPRLQRHSNSGEHPPPRSRIVPLEPPRVIPMQASGPESRPSQAGSVRPTGFIAVESGRCTRGWHQRLEDDDSTHEPAMPRIGQLQLEKALMHPGATIVRREIQHVPLPL